MWFNPKTNFMRNVRWTIGLNSFSFPVWIEGFYSDSIKCAVQFTVNAPLGIKRFISQNRHARSYESFSLGIAVIIVFIANS